MRHLAREFTPQQPDAGGPERGPRRQEVLDPAFVEAALRFASSVAATTVRGGNAVDHEDVAQEAMIKLLQHRDGRRLGAQRGRRGADRVPRGLLAAITRNTGIDALRYEARRPHCPQELAHDVESRAEDPAEVLIAREEHAERRAIIEAWGDEVAANRGKEGQLIAALVAYDPERTHKEIVAIVRDHFPATSLTPTGLRALVYRGKKRIPGLRELIERRTAPTDPRSRGGGRRLGSAPGS